ncbi:MAG: YXWGXW repeat-containing protein [Planctomycetota bacterium]|nr:YXWGXW repeat-containing protein [Planctomycetota bacterium]
MRKINYFFLVGACLLLVASQGCRGRRTRVTVKTKNGTIKTKTTVTIRTRPPARPRVVRGRAPGAGYVWVSGRYDWRGNRYVWVKGRWARPPRTGAVWVAGRWDARGGTYVFVKGRWK